MRRWIAVAALAIVAIAVAAAVAVAFTQPTFSDPESARCNAPRLLFGAKRDFGGHQEIPVQFACAGALIAGTINLPSSPGRHPAVAWVHGAGAEERLPYDGAPLVQTLVRSGVAVLSYDKRGVGGSQGECCPGDQGHFNLLAADADGAVSALRSRPEVDPDRIGLLGGSQAGWIVPLAAARSQGHVAFVALVDAPVVSFAEENLYSEKTGDNGFLGKVLWAVTTIGGLRHPGPSGFDPRPYLRQLAISGVWLYGGKDQSQPTAEDVDVLDELKAGGKDFTYRVYPKAGHGLLDVPPTDPRALPAVVRWIAQRTRR